MPGLRSVLEWLVINAAFVALNIFGALILFGLFSAARVIAPSAIENPWVTYPLGILGVAATLVTAARVCGFIGRRPPDPARARVKSRQATTTTVD